MERIYIIKYRNGEVDPEFQKEFIYDNSKFMPLYEMLKEDIRKLIH